MTTTTNECDFGGCDLSLEAGQGGCANLGPCLHFSKRIKELERRELTNVIPVSELPDDVVEENRDLQVWAIVLKGEKREAWDQRGWHPDDEPL